MNPIVTCTVNPAVDVSTELDRLEPNRKLRCASARRDPGGGGVNVARVLSRFGADVIAAFTVGGATGDLLKTLVHKEGLAHLPIPVSGETREDFTVIERSSGREFRFVLPGAPLNAGEERAILDAIAALPLPPYLVVSGSLPPQTSISLYSEIFRTAKSKGTITVLDTSGAALTETLKGGCVDIVKPNLRELRELVHAPLDTAAAQIAAARTLIETGRAKMVALTLAQHGALLVTAERIWHASAPDVTCVSTVGAGDSFLAALVFGLACKRSPEDALADAVAAGTAALLSPGTDLCRKAEMDRLRPRVRVDDVVLA